MICHREHPKWSIFRSSVCTSFFSRALLHSIVMVSYCKYINIYMLHILFWFSNNIFVAHLDYVQLFCWLCSAAHHINVCLMPILIELHTFLLIWSSQSNVWCALYIIFISHHLPFNLGVVGGSSSYSSLYKHYNSAIGSEPN